MFRPDSVTARVYEYELSRPEHRAGTVDAQVLRAMEDLAPAPVRWSMETGCGKTTILLSNLSDCHVVFALDDSAEENSSVRFYRDCPFFRAETTRLVAGPTQLTLPQFPFPPEIDFVLLDGPHAYPFPELEYYRVYPFLRTGALLVVDDIHIPTIFHLHSVLAEDEMFELVHIERTTSFFRRTAAPVFNPLGDGWFRQPYNGRRFPLDVTGAGAPRPPQREAEATQAAASPGELQALRGELAAAREEAAWWRHAAEERRLKRRLARRIGDWPFLK